MKHQTGSCRHLCRLINSRLAREPFAVPPPSRPRLVHTLRVASSFGRGRATTEINIFENSLE